MRHERQPYDWTSSKQDVLATGRNMKTRKFSLLVDGRSVVGVVVFKEFTPPQPRGTSLTSGQPQS